MRPILRAQDHDLSVDQFDLLAAEEPQLSHFVIFFLGPAARLRIGGNPRRDQVHGSPHVALAITCSCTRLRCCSFSRYSRPFLTLTWSHGNTSSIGRERCVYQSTSMPRSRNVCHHTSGWKCSRQP